MSNDRQRQRRAIVLHGTVQGVGMRPFVYALATRRNLAGFVRNQIDGVHIEIEGDVLQLDEFVAALQHDLPPAAIVEKIYATAVPVTGEREFRIEVSQAISELSERWFAPDIATCDDCVRELLDVDDRRYLYPFINCSHCGPRLTIVCDAPYDRARTTMADFAMCEACASEYHNPRDRRFHAQPIACATCGPQLKVFDAAGAAINTDALLFAKTAFLRGDILAVKGLGGYHLACDATNETAVARLRSRKHRDEKPFAVMVASIEVANQICHLSSQEAALLTSPQRPIVLLHHRSDAVVKIANSIAPHNHSLAGLMLPYTPLHHLLARVSDGRPWVMTSGNRAGEPIVSDDVEALSRLQGLADGYLTHNRKIQLRCDDSVVQVINDAPTLLRRSRGYAPQPIALPFVSTQNILAVGGHLKNTFALARGRYAVLSPHMGDLDDYGAYLNYGDMLDHYQRLYAFDPHVLAHDLHPAYGTTYYADGRSDCKRIAVQHHHAHMASCMVEHGLTGPTIGVIFDGTGYGVDGSLWGGEFLVGDYCQVRRAAHFRPVALPGGEQAIREPWRMALSHLIDADLADHNGALGPICRDVAPHALDVMRQMIVRGINAPLTSSVGRLFDAVAALIGLHACVTFEGQAAMALERLATQSEADGCYAFELDQLTPASAATSSTVSINTQPLIRDIARAMQLGHPVALIARRFHRTMAEMIATTVNLLRDETGIANVVLSGGVFCNALLCAEASARLRQHGFRVYLHHRVPPNDGGLCLGQLAVAAAHESFGER